MWVKIASYIIRYRWINLAIIALFTVFMGYHARKVEFNYTHRSIVPSTDSEYITFDKFRHLFGEDGSVIVVGVKSPKIFQLEFFNAWYDLTDSIDAIPEVEKILSITRLYNLTRNDSLAKFEVKPLFATKPTSQQELDSLKGLVDRIPVYDGLIYNQQSGATLIAITLNDKGVSTQKRLDVIARFNKLVNQFQDKYDIETYCSGIPYIRTELTATIQKELSQLTLLSIIVTSLFLLLFFRSFYAVFFSLILVIISLVFTVGSIHLFGFRIGILTALIPPLIVVVAIQNCIYLLNYYHFEVKSHGSQSKALIRLTAKIGLASFLTNVTTAIGFGVFSFSGSAMLDEFSIISAFNIMAVYVICTVLIPIILSFMPAPGSKQMMHLDRKALSGIMNFVVKVIYNHRKPVYIITVVMLLVSFFGITKIRTIGFILDDVPKSNSLYTDLKFFEKNFKGVMPFEILIDTKKEGGVKDYKTLQKIDRLQKIMAQYSEFSKPISISEMVKMANQAYYDGDPRRYLMPSVLDIRNITAYMPKGKTGSDNILKSLADSTFRYTRVSANIADVGSIRTLALQKELQQRIDSIFDPAEYDVAITGTSILHLKGNEYLIDNLTQSLIWALVIISLLMALLFFSWRMVLISLIPNVIPLLMTLGIMGYIGIPMKISTILVFSVAYGIVVDLTIHFLAKYRIELKTQLEYLRVSKKLYC